MWPHEIEKLLKSKGHCQYDKTAAYRMGKVLHHCPSNRIQNTNTKKNKTSKNPNNPIKNEVQI